MKIKPRYRGRARASPAGAPSEVSNYIPPELESIHYRDFVEFYQNNDILQISTKTSLIEWVDVLDKIDDFLSDRELPSSYLIKILGVLCALLTKTNDVRVFNSLERLVDLLWHSDCLVVLQNLHCIIALLKNLTARVSSKFVTPLRTRLQFLATGLVAFDSQSLKAIYTGEERPSSKPFTISGPSLDESVVIDVRNMGDDPVDVASKIVAKLPSSEICAFQINHRVAHMLGSKLTRQLYVHIILRAIQAGVLLPSSSSYVQLSGTVHMGQQIVALIEDLDRLPSLPQDEDIVVIALQTLQTLSSFDCYRRRMIEANIFEENGIVLNGFLLAAENLRVSIGSVSEDDLIYKRFSAYTSLISELVPSRGSSLVPDITSRSDCLSVVGTAIDDDVIVRSLVSILNCSSVCPFRTVNDVCSCLITLLLNNSAARTAFLDQNAFGPVFNQIRLILDCAPVPDSKLKEFHGAIQLLLRVILILLQRTRATLSQQILPDVSFVRVMTHLWETCMIGSSPASTPFNQSRVSSTVDMRALLMNISEPPSSASSPSHTPANQSSASSADAPAMRGSFSPTESGLLVFTTACNVVSRFIQNRPRSSQSLHREGITASYLQWFPLVLDSVSRCKPEYRESMIKILLDLIRSLSIHSAGLSAVLSADPVRRVLQLFESPEMHQFFSSSPSTVQSIGRSVEEWIRHYPDFEEPVLTAIINFLCRLQDGPGALIFGDVRDRLTSAHTLDEVFDQAIINISSFIKCVVQKHMTKFCALNGPSQLCAFASAPGACQRILGISRSSDSRESLPAFVVPSFPKSSALAGPSSFTAGKLTTAGDALADSYAWLAAQPPRLPVDVLFDRLQKSCESIIYSQAFQSPNFLWPFDELLNSRHSEQALEQAASVSSLHFYVSILLRTVYRNPSFQIRQAPLTSIFAMLSKIVAKVDWALSGLDLDSSALCDDHMKDNATSSIISILTPFKFALAQFSMTVHGVMIVFSEKSSSRSSESSMFSSIVASHTLYMINYKPALVTPNLDDALCSWSDNSRQDSPTSVGGQQSLSASWCSLFRFTAQIFENARETLFCQKNPDSFSTQEIASVQTLLSDLLKSGGITRLVELWHWIIEVRPKDYRGSSHPWYTNNSGLSRSTSKKSRKTRNQSDAPTSMPYWQWPTEFDENLLQCLDILLIALSRFIAVLSSLPRAAFSSVHDKFPILAASLFESVWKHPSSFPLPVVISMLQSSQAFFNLHSRENNASQLNAPSRVPVPVSDTDEDQYDDDNGDRNPHDMDEDDGSQSVADRDPLDNEHRALMFAQLSEMGFADQHITWALDNSSVSDFNALVDWMVEHPFSASSAVAAATRSGPAPAATVPDANPISDPQHSSSESAASASFEDKFLSVSCPNVDCIAVERAVSAAPLLICISNSFKDDTHLTEYCAELSQYISRVIASKSNDDIRIAEFNEHFIQEVVQLLDSNSISNANQTVIVQTALSVCFQTIRASKPLGKQMACSPDLCRAVLRISHELLSFSESSPFAVHIALSISGLFSWLSSIWCSAGDGLLPQVSVSLDDRLQMTNFCIQLLSSPIASDLEVTQSLLTCLIVLLSQCHVAGVSASVKPILLVRRTLPFDNAKTIANLVDGVLQMLIEDRCLVKASIKKSLKTLLESSSSSEASLSQFFDRNRNVILRSVPDFADVVVTSCQFSKKASSLNSDFSSLTLRQSCPDLSHSVERSDWCNTLGDVVDQIIFLATNDNGASLSGSFGSSLCDPLRLLHAVRTTAHLHSPHLHKYLIEYVSQPQSDKQYRFIDVLILKLLTIRGSNLRTDVCNAELSTALAKDLRRAAQMTLIELCVAGDDIAIPVFECLRDAIRRDAGDDRCVARYATAILSLLRNSPNERDRACAMIKIGIIPTLIDALQSLNLKGQQFSECCDGILRALEAFGSLDLTTALDRFEPDIADAENQADSSCPMDIVSGFIDQFPNQGSRNSSLETLGNDVVDNVQEMVEENTNEDQEADVADQEDLALAERQNEEDDLHDDADGDIEDDIAASDFIHGLLHFGAPAHDEYEESEYDEEVDIANQNGDDDEEDDNEDEDDDELAIADLSSSTLNIRSSNIRGLHAFSQRIFPQQLSELAPIRRPVVDIGINFGNMPALNQTDERLRRVLDDFQSSLETSDIDVLVSNGSIPISRQEEMTRRRLSTASHGNIIVRASRHPDDELPWLNETSVAIRTSSSRPQTLRRNTVPGDGQRLREIILDSNARLPSRLQNRQLSGSMSSSSWATRMMELSGPRIKEAIGSYFRLEYEKQQTRMQIQAQQCQQPEPNALTEPVADETESVASTNVAVSVASGNAVGCPDIPMNTVEEHAVASADELEENMFQVAEMQFAPTSEPSEEAQGQAESTSASHNAESGLSEEERLAFLAALPPELQAEILLQDSRQQAANSNPEAINPSLVADIDSASIIATLPPDVREDFLMTQDDNFLSSLPPELMAEAVLLRQRSVYSERDEFPPSIRRRGQQARPPASTNVESVSQPPSTPTIPLLPLKLVVPLINLFKVRNFDCLTTVQRVIRIMAQFPQTRESLLKVLYSICIAFSPSRSSHPPKRLPFYLLSRALNTLRFLSKSSCREEILLWFLLPEDSAPIYDILPLLYVSRLDMSEATLLSLLGFLEDLLNVFKDGSGLAVKIKQSDVPVPSISSSAVANIVAIANAKICTARISDMIMSSISVFAKSPKNRSIIINELIRSLKTIRAGLQPFNLESRRPCDIALFQSMVLRNLNLLKSVIPDFKDLDEESSTAVMSCLSDLSPLWSELHRLLCSLQNQGSDNDSVANGDNFNTAVLEKSLQYKPFIEAMFVQRKIASTPELNKTFQVFCQTHRRILNFLCSRYPKLLSGSLSELISMRSGNILDFENKRRYFRTQLESQFSSFRSRYRSVKLQVRRSRLFEDSYHQVRNQTLDELRSHMTVHFMGEEGMDAGGLTREWFLIMSREIFNPNYALFRNAADSQVVFQPNKFSYWNPEHIDFFKFVGRFVGKAIYQGCLLDAYFTRSFYKHMLGIKPSFSDMESIDPDFFKSLKWMLANPIKGVLDLTFSAETHEFGERRVFALKPNGANIQVTDENKHKYVSLITELRTTTEIKSQIEAFVAGFHELIPRELINVFNDHDLELLICGLPEIDISDLRANTEYHGLSETSDVIQWFWAALQSFTSEEKALFIQFVTGTSKVPIGGFRVLQGMSGIQKFQIHRATGIDRLPTTHTCFNQLDLPDYSSPDSLADKLRLAISEGATGFGFA